MVLTEDERRELQRLLAKSAAAEVVHTEGSMTDAPKRRRFEGDDAKTSGYFGSEQLPISKATAMTAVVKTSGSASSQRASLAEDDGEDDQFLLVSYTGGEGAFEVSLPENTTKSQWDRTIAELPKLNSVKEWKGRTYAALVEMSATNAELTKYLAWVRTKFGHEYKGGQPRSQAVDLAGYLTYVGFTKSSGFQRKLAQ
ncbi:unnamed protein product [Symbiodinium natans]|uniref:Uncharacterized protein n=1 Tax=Symbiodinium natans TaxID=878477 RepID=A0A812QVC0_9DINO|nr:unnamed protein product [Symbiodinium natans]